MASALPSVPISSTRNIHVAGRFAIPTMRLWVQLAFARFTGVPLGFKCLLDTGAPLSVIPYDIHHNNGLAWHPLRGPWHPGLTTWWGVPCTT
jgi:hypothetical protein